MADLYETEVLIHLGHGPLTGRELRERMNLGRRWWDRWSRVGFYTLMARLKYSGAVRTDVRTKTVDGVTVKEWWYSLAGG